LALHVLAALSVTCIFGASLRIASQATGARLERLVAAAVIAAAIICAEALALGVFGLADQPVVLAVVAGATWLVAWRLVPAAEEPLLRQLARSWTELSVAGRAVAGTLAGAAVVWILWPLHDPTVSYDGISYHMPEVLGWARNGRPGQAIDVSYLFPFASYPVTNEVVLAWLTSISRGFAFAAIWTPLLHVLMAAAGWLGLRSLRVPRLHAALAVAAVWSIPIALDQVNAPSTDLAGLAWAVCAAALAAAAMRTARLYPIAILAAGLAIGTKTSTAIVVAVALAIALYRLRARARRMLWPIGLALAAAFVVGGIWYLRNLIEHGSPLWPFQKTPGGDRPSAIWGLLHDSLLDRPGKTLDGREHAYLDVLGGGAVLLVGVVVMPLLARSRAVLAAALVALAAALAWANAPSTGVPDVQVLIPNLVGTIRYALPALAAAALVPALAARAGGIVAWVSGLALAGAVVWNVVRMAEIGEPQLPSLVLVAVAAAAGGAVGGVTAWLPRTLRRAPPAAITATAVAVLAGLVLGQQAGGYVERLTPNAEFFPSASVVAWFTSQKGFNDDSRPIAVAGQLVAPLAGNRLTHRLTLIPQRESCAATRARRAREWVVVANDPYLQQLVEIPATRCFVGVKPVAAIGAVRVYGGGA
jgi:hypothetical protein